MHREEYNILYGTSDKVDELLCNLSLYFDNYLTCNYWMTMPDMRHIIASRYNVVLVHLSMQQYLTFLPLRSNPLSINLHITIAIGFVNGNYFVEALYFELLK